MNNASCATFPSRVDLTLKRRVYDRSPVAEDLEILRACEENLRRYEMRLRALQAELEAAGAFVRPPSASPFDRPIVPPAPDHESVQAAWDKVYRARSLLEAEQVQMRDERRAMKETAEALARREQAVAAREAIMAEAEEQAAAAEVSEHSSVARLARAPLEMARSVFGRASSRLRP